MYLSTPAYIASVAYLVMLIVILFTPSSVIMQGDPHNKPPTLSSKIINVVLLLIPVALSVYSINCFVVGGCVVWSWINAISILLWVLLFVLAIILSAKQSKGLPNVNAFSM